MRIIIFVCATIFFCMALATTNHERPIVIVTASYNNAQWYAWNLDSVFNQEYKNWHIIYIDDCSPDGTGQLVREYIKERGFEDKVTLLCNNERRGAMANQYTAIHACDPRVIVVILDGDDRFAHSQVLATINDVYADGNTWLTYGQFIEYPSGRLGFCAPMPQNVVANNTFRYYEHIPSHLRTFYAGLFQKIKLEDLMFEDRFFPMAPDMAAMMPMIEMACDHFRFIPYILLEYNAVNPLSEHRISVELQRKCDQKIRSMARYDKIQNPF